MSTDLIPLSIESIAAGGDGVARHGGLVVFVPRTAPGDRVQANVFGKKTFARGRLRTVVEPSPSRVVPPCPHYVNDDCGGCQLQHMSYDAQLEAKGEIIRDGLVRIGRRSIDPPAVRPSPEPLRYRTKLTLAMHRRDGQWIMGLHPYHDPVGVFQLKDCLITDQRVMDAWHQVQAASALLPPARELRGSIRVTAEGQMICVIEGGTQWARGGEFLHSVPALAELWWHPVDGPRHRIGSRSPVQAGASFAQVNPGVAAELQQYLMTLAAAHAPSTALDLYAGAGDTAVALASTGARVIAVESDAAAARLVADRLPQGSRSVVGRVEDELESLLPVDLVVANPPRSGLDAQVTTLLQEAATPPSVILYVSCNPATLGRDLARMPRYAVRSIAAFDMFPQTAHVETVCELVPEGA
jgi:23S rRNA (uracil1939-C5)-methyltransferase